MRIVRKISSEKNSRPNLIRTGWLFWLTLITAVSIQVYSTIYTLALGNKLSIVEKNTKELSQNSQKIKDELIEVTSLVKFEEKAQDLGYSSNIKTIYIRSDEFVAKAAQ